MTFVRFPSIRRLVAITLIKKKKKKQCLRQAIPGKIRNWVLCSVINIPGKGRWLWQHIYTWRRNERINEGQNLCLQYH